MNDERDYPSSTRFALAFARNSESNLKCVLTKGYSLLGGY